MLVSRGLGPASARWPRLSWIWLALARPPYDMRWPGAVRPMRGYMSTHISCIYELHSVGALNLLVAFRYGLRERCPVWSAFAVYCSEPSQSVSFDRLGEGRTQSEGSGPTMFYRIGHQEPRLEASHSLEVGRSVVSKFSEYPCVRKPVHPAQL